MGHIALKWASRRVIFLPDILSPQGEMRHFLTLPFPQIRSDALWDLPKNFAVSACHSRKMKQ